MQTHNGGHSKGEGTKMSASHKMEENEILTFFHCAKCMRDKPPNLSPRQYVRNEIGFTPKGLQIWCIRHEENIIHLDFRGQKIKVLHDDGESDFGDAESLV